MRSRDIDYYTHREEQERARAERSDDSAARRIHLEMAQRYALLLRETAPPQART